MKKYKHTSDENENPFALSIGDLMASLLLIFILLLASILYDIKTKSDFATRFRNIKIQIYDSLNVKFKDELKNWKADIDSNTLTIRFKEPDVLFETNKFEITNSFKAILNDFFPDYIEILLKFKDNIEEIRIEGHTDNIGNYYHNMELSQNRTRSVLNYVLEETLSDSIKKIWVQEKLTANGLSFSKPIDTNNTETARKSNRRVEFRIRTNAESQIDSIHKFSIRL